MKILVTGGAGYIGSHTSLELLAAGHEVVVVDNLCNSQQLSLHRVEELTGRSLSFSRLDLLNESALDRVFDESKVDAVIHFAALKAVGESVADPVRYYHNNVTGTLTLCRAMVRHGVKRLVFSSSATVYGEPEGVPIPEDVALAPANPYGRTKLVMEGILRDLYVSDPSWAVSILRYFNPVGAHGSGQIGEDPRGVPNNLMPFVAQVAVGRLPHLQVFGDDYLTPDGTGVRDYIHVVDLAMGHLRALELVNGGGGLWVHNLGTGRGHSVLEVVQAFEKASGQEIPYSVVERRPGDVAVLVADPARANDELGWRTQRGLDEMCVDMWRWQSMNPEGFRDAGE